MRTVLALLLLAAASQAYLVKTGGLKGSWATDVVVLGPNADMLAPVLTSGSFMIESAAADYMYNASDPTTTYIPDVDYEVTDANDINTSTDHTCMLTFGMWDAVTMMMTAEMAVTYPYDENTYLYIPDYYWPGTYESMLSCWDQTGNMAWWDSMTSAELYAIVYANHEVDMTPFELSAFTLEGANTGLSYALTDSGSDMSYELSVDFDLATPSAMNDYTYAGGATFMGVWTPTFGTSMPMSWDATYCSYGTSGYCSVSIYLTRDSEPGTFAFTSATVWDMAGNMPATALGGLTATLQVVDDPNHTLTVVSCQTVMLTAGSLTPDVTLSYDYIDVTIGCTIKTDLASASNWAYIIYVRDQLVQYMDNGVSTLMSGGVSGNNYADFTTLSNLDGTLSTSVSLDYGYPMGPYRLDELTTVTSYGATQTYTFALGSASSAAPSVAVALVAAAVAMLRL
jgi:hypothetical protein